jgi:hypothetical protein
LYCAVLAVWSGQELPAGALAAEDEAAAREWHARVPDPRAAWDGFLFPPPTAGGAAGAVGTDAGAASGFMRRAFARAEGADARCSRTADGAARLRADSSPVIARHRDWCRHLAFHFDDVEQFWAHVRTTSPPRDALVAIDFGAWCGCVCSPRLHIAAGLRGGAARGPRLRCLLPPPPPAAEAARAAGELAQRKAAGTCRNGQLSSRPTFASALGSGGGSGSGEGGQLSTRALLNIIAALAVALLSFAYCAIENSERGWAGSGRKYADGRA